MRLTKRLTALAIAGGWCLSALACSGGSGEASNNNVNVNYNPPVCGDGIIESRYGIVEDCDGTDLDGYTCQTYGWEGGELQCNECVFDLSGCYGPNPCGNGVIDAREGCDGTNLNGMTCAEWYPGFFVGGEISCGPLCSHNIYGCIANANCGNGVNENGEMCDNGSSNSDTLPGACRTNCRFAGCGDGVVDTGETCDNGVDNSNVLPDACRGDCHPARCGDAVADTNEVCDGSDLAGATCQSQGFSAGHLGCSPVTCTYDTSRCEP